jgi:hypothetical protein
MLGSTSNFFHQDRETLAYKRHLLLLLLHDYEVKDYSKWLDAFDYFRNNPNEFDGATLVKDLTTINGLDAPAMIHDYDYGFIDFWSRKGFFEKLKADFNYGKNQEKTGVGSITAYTRTVLLWLSTPFYYILLIFKK